MRQADRQASSITPVVFILTMKATVENRFWKVTNEVYGCFKLASIVYYLKLDFSISCYHWHG